MGELKVTFKLSDRDVKHLRRIMRKASAAAKTRDEDSIIKAAKGMASEVRKFKPPQYVLSRMCWNTLGLNLKTSSHLRTNQICLISQIISPSVTLIKGRKAIMIKQSG